MPRAVQVLARGLAHRRDGVLGARVQRARQRAAPGDARGQQQVPARVLQRRDRRAQRQRGAVDVRQDHLAPVLGRVLEEAARAAEAGVREDRVDLSEARERALDELPAAASHSVTSQGTAIARARAAELRGELLERVLRARREHEPPAGRCGVARGRGADPRGGAGDQQDAVGRGLRRRCSSWLCSLLGWSRGRRPSTPRRAGRCRGGCSLGGCHDGRRCCTIARESTSRPAPAATAA